MNYYYEKSGILDSEVNITYHELFCKTDDELDLWIEEVRQYIIKEWDEKGIPPLVGQSIEDIIKSFKGLDSLRISVYPYSSNMKKELLSEIDSK